MPIRPSPTLDTSGPSRPSEIDSIGSSVTIAGVLT
jgi:hypothetical protein